MRPPSGMTSTSHPMLSQVARNDPQVTNALQVSFSTAASTPQPDADNRQLF
jgi:hypothetical protein